MSNSEKSNKYSNISKNDQDIEQIRFNEDKELINDPKGFQENLLNSNECNNKQKSTTKFKGELFNYTKNQNNKIKKYNSFTNKFSNNLSSKNLYSESLISSNLTIREYNSDFNITQNYPLNFKSRSMCNRYFSKMNPGSLRSSIFSLSILCIGIGCLTLPKKIEQLSIVIGIITICLCAFSTFLTVNIIIKAGIKKRLTVYSKVVEAYLGRTCCIIFEINQMIYLFGLLISYQIIIYQMIGGFLYKTVPSFTNNNTNVEEFLKHSVWSKNTTRLIGMISTALFVLLPLNLLKDISKLRFSTVFGVICFSIISIVIVIQLPWYLIQFCNEKTAETNINVFNLKKAFAFDNFYFYKAIGTIIFTMNCHIGIFPVYDKLSNNTDIRTQKVINRSILLDNTFFIIVGLCGYLTQPYNTVNIIMNRPSLKDDKDVLMIICKLLFVLFLFAKVPVVYNSLRIGIFNFFLKTNEIKNIPNIIITIIITLSTAIIGALYSDIDNILQLLGGVCGCIISYFFPCLLYIKFEEVKFKELKNYIIVLICVVMVFLGMIAGCLSVVSIFKGENVGH